ncbi:MAG: YggS family pyridoxal phosphate-dependent enzyme [Lachnospiraceae bacterium]|nr:YggS family pyridoxal phosphate-dependent enzyme [Lachnospiraceae bacterium]
MIKENYETVCEKIREACKRAGRDESEVTLISVSKTKPMEDIAEAYEAGARDFGENKVQELVKKHDEGGLLDAKWHMIGHLQRNKVKDVVGRAVLIHSVDSFRLAEEINIQGKKKGVTVPVLIELNVAEEESKFGVSLSDAEDLISQISENLSNVSVKGLMTVAPYVVDSEQNREIFHKIKDLSVDIAAKNYDNVSMDILSMGMTGDYEVAIEEGSTMVRVGTGIFGERNYKI